MTKEAYRSSNLGLRSAVKRVCSDSLPVTSVAIIFWIERSTAVTDLAIGFVLF
jgi:hypothetical protein